MENSFICKLICDNPDSWKDICEDKLIRVKLDENTPYAIFNYQINADFFDPIVQEARGIIIDTEIVDVVCFPFKKFGNFGEPYVDTIDWTTARVQEKVDGSIVKLWFDKRNGVWVWSTNSCIHASEASTQSGRNFQSIINSTPEFKYLKSNEDTLNKNYTYIFELVSPDNQIVIRYSEARLCHLGTRDNVTGRELDIGIGINKPKEYPLHSLEACKKAVTELNKGDFPDAEGFVVVDANWHRIKVKSPEYLVWHHAVNNGILDKDTAYDLVYSDDFNFELFKDNVSPYIVDRMTFYIGEFEIVKKKIVAMVLFARELRDNGLSRKDIALKIKDSLYSFYGFKGLDNGENPDDLIKVLGKSHFLKVVPEYTE